MWWAAVTPPGTLVETSVGVFTQVQRHLTYDIHSMRKVQERDEIPVLVFENGSDTVRMGYSVSALLMRN